MGNTCCSVHIALTGTTPDAIKGIVRAYATLGFERTKTASPEASKHVILLRREGDPFLSVYDSDNAALDTGELKDLALAASKIFKTAAVCTSLYDSDTFEVVVFNAGNKSSGSGTSWDIEFGTTDSSGTYTASAAYPPARYPNTVIVGSETALADDPLLTVRRVAGRVEPDAAATVAGTTGAAGSTKGLVAVALSGVVGIGSAFFVTREPAAPTPELASPAPISVTLPQDWGWIHRHRPATDRERPG